MVKKRTVDALYSFLDLQNAHYPHRKFTWKNAHPQEVAKKITPCACKVITGKSFFLHLPFKLNKNTFNLFWAWHSSAIIYNMFQVHILSGFLCTVCVCLKSNNEHVKMETEIGVKIFLGSWEIKNIENVIY